MALATKQRKKKYIEIAVFVATGWSSYPLEKQETDGIFEVNGQAVLVAKLVFVVVLYDSFMKLPYFKMVN